MSKQDVQKVKEIEEIGIKLVGFKESSFLN